MYRPEIYAALLGPALNNIRHRAGQCRTHRDAGRTRARLDLMSCYLRAGWASHARIRLRSNVWGIVVFPPDLNNW